MTDTLCYFTTFVCHYDQLPLVAKRYQERLAQVAALPGHAIVLSAEEVCDLGRESLIFDLLIKEILDEPWTAEEAESYSTFMLTTIIDLPDDGTDDPVWDVINLLNFDYFDDFPTIVLVPDAAVEEVAGLLDGDPGEFVSHTEVIRMSPTGSDVLTPVSRQA